MKNIKLPDGWKIDILDNVTHVIRNGANIKQGEFDGGYPITRIETIANSFIDVNRLGYAGLEELGKYKGYLLQKGDILMSHINSEKHLGKVAIYENCNIEIIHGMNLLCLRFNNGTILPEYAYYFLNTKKFKIQLPRITKKSVNQASFSISDLKDLKIIVPPIEIQKKIVEVLDKAQELIDKRKEQIEALDELVKSRFIEMFGDEENYSSSDMRDVAMITGGLTKNAKRKEFENKMPYLRVANVFYNRLDLKEILEIGVKDSEIEKTTLKKGDLLFVEGNGSLEQIGRVAIWDGSIQGCLHQNHLIKARFSEQINSVYALHYFMSQRGRQQIIKKSVSTSGLNTLSISKIQDLQIPLPPIELQNQFAEFVKQVDKLKFEMEKSLKELENNFNSLMQKAFKGDLF